MSALSLRLPESLHRMARDIAKKERISVNLLITSALAEKVSALATEEYLEQRAARASTKKFRAALAQVRDVEPVEHDRIQSRDRSNGALQRKRGAR